MGWRVQVSGLLSRAHTHTHEIYWTPMEPQGSLKAAELWTLTPPHQPSQFEQIVDLKRGLPQGKSEILRSTICSNCQGWWPPGGQGVSGAWSCSGAWGGCADDCQSLQFGHRQRGRAGDCRFWRNNCFAEMRCGSEEGSYLRLVDFCTTHP